MHFFDKKPASFQTVIHVLALPRRQLLMMVSHNRSQSNQLNYIYILSKNKKEIIKLINLFLPAQFTFQAFLFNFLYKHHWLCSKILI